MMRVLYVNDTARMSGAEHSLLVLLRSVAGEVSPVLACPEGELAIAARALGVDVRPIPGSDLSARLHPLHTGREAVRAALTALAIGSLAREVGAEIVHANTLRAGLMCALARGAGGAAPVVHVRDSTPPGRLPGLLLSLVAARAAAFVPTSRFLATHLPNRPSATIVANAVEPDRFDPTTSERQAARARLGLGERAPVLAVVGQISPHKGQSDAIRALAILRRTHRDARLLLVGSVKFVSAATRLNNRAYGEELGALADRLGVREAVTFLGERDDIADILAAVDVLLVPSWYEPFGRVALEAMIMRVPVIVTSVGGTKEFVTDGVDGLVLAPKDPERWAAAASSLVSDPHRRSAMGARGRERALRDFSPRRHAAEMVAVYQRVLWEGIPDHARAGVGRAAYTLAPTDSGNLSNG